MGGKCKRTTWSAKRRRKDRIVKAVKVVACVLACLVAAVGLYFAMYAVFAGDGPVGTGAGLEKRDWLAFAGSYLAFAGSLVVGAVAVLQNILYERRDNQRRELERDRQIRPVLSVVRIEKGSAQEMPAGGRAASVFDLPDSVLLRIENKGAYPAENVIAFGKYLTHCLAPGGAVEVICCYAEDPPSEVGGVKVVSMLQADEGRNSAGLPEWFTVNYYNADGVEQCQGFEAACFEGDWHYVFKGADTV